MRWRRAHTRTEEHIAEPPPLFRVLLAQELTVTGSGTTPRQLAARLRALGRRDPGGVHDPDWPLHPVIDRVVHACATVDPIGAHHGAGWVGAMCTGDAGEAHRARAHAARTGAGAALARIAAAWAPLRTVGVRRIPLWRVCVLGAAEGELLELCADGIGGDGWSYARALGSVGWQTRAPFGHLGADAEVDHVRRTLAACHAARSRDDPRPITCTIRVEDATALVRLAEMLGADRLTCAVTSEVAACTTRAEVSIDGLPLVVQVACLAPAACVADGPQATTAWARGIAGGAIHTEHAATAAIAPGIRIGAPRDADGPAGRDITARLSARPCRHRDASWSLTHTGAGVALRCPSCAHPQRAFCWRDDLPETHPHHVAPHSPEARRCARIRSALRCIGRTAPAGVPWAESQLLPRAWATAPAAAPAPTTPHGPETALTRRRARAA